MAAVLCISPFESCIPIHPTNNRSVRHYYICIHKTTHGQGGFNIVKLLSGINLPRGKFCYLSTECSLQ